MREGTESRFARTEEATRRGDLPEAAKRDIDHELANVKQMLEQQRARERQLRSSESELSGMILAEQARWTDFNARIDELERALPPAAQR